VLRKNGGLYRFSRHRRDWLPLCESGLAKPTMRESCILEKMRLCTCYLPDARRVLVELGPVLLSWLPASAKNNGHQMPIEASHC